MFAPGRVPARIARRHMIMAATPVALTALAILGGCSFGEDDPPVAVPTSPPLSAPPDSGATPSSAPSSLSPRDAVIAAYHDYWAATRKAATLPLDQVRRTLEPYSTEGVIEDQVKGIRELQAKNQEPWGQIKIHVYAVDVQGSTAQLSDCQDGSNAGLADRRTHQLIPGTRGSAQPYNFSVRLQRGTDARWRVSSIRTVENPCTLERPGLGGGPDTWKGEGLRHPPHPPRRRRHLPPPRRHPGLGGVPDPHQPRHRPRRTRPPHPRPAPGPRQTLDGCYYWWLPTPLIETMRAAITDTARSLAEHHLAAHDPAAAAAAARTGLLCDPAAEQLWRIIMRAEHTTGNTAGVHEAWTNCLRELAAIDPDLEPHPDTTALYQQVIKRAG